MLTFLLKSSGAPVSTAATNSGGAYVFDEVEPGDYNVVETQRTGYPAKRLCDEDKEPDCDTFDNNKAVDDMIEVTLEAGLYFVDSDNGGVSGAVSDVNANKRLFVDSTLAVIHRSN
jgi:hypothetical protein